MTKIVQWRFDEKPSFISIASSIRCKYFVHRCKHLFVTRSTSFPLVLKQRKPNYFRYFCLASRSETDGSKLSETFVRSEEPLRLKLWRTYTSLATLLTNLFPLWTLLVAVVALKRPTTFTWLSTPYFTFTLSVLMLSMGITLSPRDFKRIMKRPGIVILQFCSCYFLVPLLAYVLGRLFKLPSDILAGLVLVGSVNGGQASNLCTYIAKGNVALSVIMTTATTLGAIVMTPLRSKFVLGTVVQVDALGIAWSTIQVVLVPIALVIGVAATCLVVGSAVAQCNSLILSAGISLQIPIFLLHLIGGICGYVLPYILGYNEVVCRTVAIETAMKSSAFGFVLACLHFAAYRVRVPCAISVVWMSLVGSGLAVFWRYKPVQNLRGFRSDLAQRLRQKRKITNSS
ncbi:hypothetical protein GAYE_SCF22MG4162 [Galdieria yellowstonensis]|uniref:Uncharacterized protein n=1 Tax=Galdieria yellowstonensis TaxID=3028027 RepID=A0AAV9IFX4_9RHOD|nr:hypothetical protein GAYE_SCF22MG4162 [Galdieria yellowstonensis]